MVDVQCYNCGKRFLKSIGRFNEAKKLKWNFYCSRNCQAAILKRRVTFVCENEYCGKKFERLKSGISKHNFCSQACAAIINSQKYPKRGQGFVACSRCSKHFKGGNLYCSPRCAKDGRRGYSVEELLATIRLFFEKEGRVPARREIPQISSLCRRAFGSWNSSVIRAGLEPNRSHEKRMYKRIMTKAKDGHFCDSISEAIVDNWLTANRVKHKKDFLYPHSKHRADWSAGVKNL